MGSMGSLARATSGLTAGQMGLNVTGHNLANVNTPGYVRQRTIQTESGYMKIGNTGANIVKVGNGVDIAEIQQIRDVFLDRAYRSEASKLGFYSTREKAVGEIEAILGEIHGAGLGAAMQDIWYSLNELSNHPEGLETRGTFIQNAVVFVSTVNAMWNQMEKYQYGINNQIQEKAEEINSLALQIANLNKAITKYEGTGDNANDLRDERNNVLDRLSSLIRIQYREDGAGQVHVMAEGGWLVSGLQANRMIMEQTEPGSPFVNPIWADTKTSVFNLSNGASPETNTDNGELKSLLFIRGDAPANHTTPAEKANQFLLPKIQREFDILINGIVSMINEVVAPKSHTQGPQGLDGSQYVEIFSRKNVSRYDENGVYIEEDESNKATLYSAGNLKVNPEVLTDYNKIPLSEGNDRADNTLVQKMLTLWKTPSITYNQAESQEKNFEDYYAEFISRVGMEGNTAANHAENQTILLNQIDNNRSAVSGVSLDEEMGNMMKYQHAYNAATRVITTIDSMLDTIINRMLR